MSCLNEKKVTLAGTPGIATASIDLLVSSFYFSLFIYIYMYYLEYLSYFCINACLLCIFFRKNQ